MSKWVRCGTVDCRVLILYRMAPDAPISLLPGSVRPAEVQGRSLAGIAFCRRSVARARILRAPFTAWQTAVHFVLACDPAREPERLVAWVTRRDCSSCWQLWGRWQLWGSHRGSRHHARFHVTERGDGVDLSGDSDDRSMHVALQADLVPAHPEGSIFRSAEQARQCLWEPMVSLGLAGGSIGAARSAQVRFQPLKARMVEASVFERLARDARGQIEFDSAYWLRDDELVWTGEGTLCCDVATA